MSVASTDDFGPRRDYVDGALLLGLSLMVTLLGTQVYYRIRGQPINNSVAGLVMGMCTGAIVFSDVWWYLFRSGVPHKAIQLQPGVFYNILIPPIVFNSGFTVKKKLFFKNLVTITIFGIFGCAATAVALSVCLSPVLANMDLNSLHLPSLDDRAGIPPPQTDALEQSQLQPSGFFEPEPALVVTQGNDSEVETRGSDWWQLQRGPMGWLLPRGNATAGQEPGASLWQSHAGGNVIQQAIRLAVVFSPSDTTVVLHYLSPTMQPVLHSLLFGEGVMNDITAVVLLRLVSDMQTMSVSQVVFQHFGKFVNLFLSSSATGVAAGLLAALLTKHFFAGTHHHTDREVILMTAIAVISYAFAVFLDMSGILAVFFCGITMSHYTWHSISASARVMSVHNFRVLASVAEMFLFIYAGLDSSSQVMNRLMRLHDPGHRQFLLSAVQLAASLLFFILVVRALFVAVAVAIVNLWRSYKFTLREAMMMWYGGLVRGSMSVALMYSYFHNAKDSSTEDESQKDESQQDAVVMVAGILVVVVSTVFIGGCSGSFMRCLVLSPVQSRLVEMFSLVDGSLREDEGSINSASVLSSQLHKLWRKFDRNVMQRLFGGRDSRMPGYLNSVTALNQQILHAQENGSATAGVSHLPVSPVLRQHALRLTTYPDVLARSPSSRSSIQTRDFQGGDAASEQGGELSGTNGALESLATIVSPTSRYTCKVPAVPSNGAVDAVPSTHFTSLDRLSNTLGRVDSDGSSHTERNDLPYTSTVLKRMNTRQEGWQAPQTQLHVQPPAQQQQHTPPPLVLPGGQQPLAPPPASRDALEHAVSEGTALAALAAHAEAGGGAALLRTSTGVGRGMHDVSQLDAQLSALYGALQEKSGAAAAAGPLSARTTGLLETRSLDPAAVQGPLSGRREGPQARSGGVVGGHRGHSRSDGVIGATVHSGQDASAPNSLQPGWELPFGQGAVHLRRINTTVEGDGRAPLENSERVRLSLTASDVGHGDAASPNTAQGALPAQGQGEQSTVGSEEPCSFQPLLNLETAMMEAHHANADITIPWAAVDEDDKRAAAASPSAMERKVSLK